MDQPIALQTLSMPGELQAATRLVVAALAGFAIGIEREWSRHTVGDARSFAGARTFLALGIVGGICGLLLSGGYAVAGAALLGVTGALVVVGYQHSVRGPTGDPGGTTETAALATLGLAALAGVGSLRIAGGCAALIALMLREKAALHGLIRRIDKPELHAATQFAVLALVVLPVLPVGPYGPLGGVRPRALWAIVLLFCGVNFLGYLARRAVGVRRGYGLAGMLGGLVSSTGVTLHFSRRSREQPALADGLALGVLGACLVLLPRVVIVSAALAPPVALALLPLLALPVLVALVPVVVGLVRARGASQDDEDDGDASPLGLVPAIKMAVVFQVAIMLLHAAQRWGGSEGVMLTAALLGLTDADALTVSMARMAAGGGAVALAAQAITVGILSNTLVKLSLALALGGSSFRKRAGSGLFAMAVALAASLFVALRA